MVSEESFLFGNDEPCSVSVVWMNAYVESDPLDDSELS